ncbi:MAG: hypothetical protein RIM99_09405 [Cyclobacteriaceae bacterium]
MIVKFEKCELKIDEIQKEGISRKKFADYEKKVIELIKSWKENKPYFEFKTSGSTGKPKTVRISRNKIEYSCRSTMEKIDPDNTFSSSLLCINPEMIGGAMVVFRSLIRNLNLRVIAPQSDPLSQIESENEYYDLVSLVPLQMQLATKEQVNRFKILLIGGAVFGGINFQTNAKIYATFGMTETVSHFALRESTQSFFECVGDAIIKKTNDGRLKVSGTITDDKWLTTNDLIAYQSPVRFKWIGRSDFIINTGGVKINPEETEARLAHQLNANFIITSVPDNKLGNKIILLIEGQPHDVHLNIDMLEKYEKPGNIHFLEKFVRTKSDKPDRIRTREVFLSQLKEE